LSCPRGCFNYNFHRDPETREFMHGHFFARPPRRERENAEPGGAANPAAPGG
jgi:hypothetical protein